jgi:rare lipoprotein A (peptidoglycan hydrolase)
MDIYGGNDCGRFIEITNTQNSQSVKVMVADACPTCDNSNSIDLSVGAFQQIASLDQGIVPSTRTHLTLLPAKLDRVVRSRMALPLTTPTPTFRLRSSPSIDAPLFDTG